MTLYYLPKQLLSRLLLPGLSIWGLPQAPTRYFGVTILTLERTNERVPRLHVSALLEHRCHELDIRSKSCGRVTGRMLRDSEHGTNAHSTKLASTARIVPLRQRVERLRRDLALYETQIARSIAAALFF
jgi:hypothetical protein